MVPTQCGLSTAKPVHYVTLYNDKYASTQSPSTMSKLFSSFPPNSTNSSQLTLTSRALPHFFFSTVPMQQLQDLTFALCHCYPNWSDSIKLPVPTQLAHKLAYQMGESLISKPDIHQELYKTYFYL